MKIVRVFASTILLCLIVTALIGATRDDMTLAQSISYVIYVTVGYGVVMLVLDYVEARGRRKE